MIHTRQYLAALMPYENALLLNLMRYHETIKKPSEFDVPAGNYKDYKITPQEMEMAKKLVKSMSVKWNPKNYRDEFQEKLQKLVKAKMHHTKSKRRLKKGKESKTTAHKNNVIDFVDIMKKSLKNKQKKRHHK